MEDSKQFYKALGLSPGASIPDVKKAYKKKQFELHPAGPARRKMMETEEYKAMSEEQKKARNTQLDDEVSKVNEAFSVLSDEKKKNDYDTGAGAYSQFSGMDGFSGFGDIFSNFSGRGGRRQKQKAKDVVCDVKVDYKDIFLGKLFKFRVKTQKVCKPCNGRGFKESSTCGRCKGAGTVLTKVSLGIMTSSMMVECPDCNGQGYTGKGPACGDCNGNKVINDSKIIELAVPAGHQSGVPMVFQAQGNEYPGYLAGDLVFNIVLNEKEGYTRVGNDFVCSVEVDILTALAGGVVYFEHPTGKLMAIKIQPIKNFEAAIVVPNEGFPSSKGRRGHLYIKPKILVNNGLDRARLSEYLKPLVSKPPGEFININSTFGTAPEPEEEQSEYEGHGGFNASDFFKFF